MSPSDPTGQFVEQLTAAQSRLFTFIFSLLGNPELTADVLQETNRVLWEKRNEFELDSDFRAWSFAIARYQVRACRLRHSRDRLVFNDVVINQLSDRASRDAISDDLDAHQVALTYCLGGLSESQKQLMQAHYRDNRGLAELAAEQGRKADSLAVTMHRIRKALRDCVSRRLKESRS